jgi:hypothetical protein
MRRVGQLFETQNKRYKLPAKQKRTKRIATSAKKSIVKEHIL